jgi:cardiolipin synthase A/B
MDDARARAERFVRAPVRLGDLALAFDATTAATVDVRVGGDAFFPLILDDIASATSSVHVNQYGFRPGEIGERFARALLAKAAEGVAVRVVVDRVGSRPGRSGGFYERLRAGGVDVRVMRAPGRIDHRKLFVVDGRVGWVGGAGIEDHFADGRFHDLFVRLTGPVVAQLQLVFLASFRWLGGDVAPDHLGALFPDLEPGTIPATVLHNAPGPYRPIATAIAELFDGARDTLDVVNPYVADKGMIRRIAGAARRGVCA